MSTTGPEGSVPNDRRDDHGLDGTVPAQPATPEAGGSEPPAGIPVYVTAPAEEPPQPRLSIVRIAIAMVVLALLALGGTEIVVRAAQHEDANDTQWFAPYVDVTLTPALDFQDPVVNPNLDVVLAFVVAASDDACEPSWGTFHSLDGASSELDLDRRIARQRQRGGDVIVSFGGVANDELGTGCTDPARLATAYQAVVTRYDLHTIDLDLEGAALTDPVAARRRAEAIAAVQSSERDAGRTLGVWLTLPVSPTGLEPDGVAAVDAFLDAGVDLAGVDVMAMNFGASRPAGVDLVEASMDAVDATQVQLVQAYGRVGTTLSPATAYARMGITPMIGQNDVLADRLDTAGAQEILEQSRARGVTRLSMWSLNRDAPCGGNVDVAIASATCSGVPQNRLEFSRILGAVGGRPAGAAVRSEDAGTTRSTGERPAVDPYDGWRPRREYDTGAKVLWGGQVYVAKWWNVGFPPDQAVEHEWESPWRVIGPVLDTDTAPTTATTLPDGTYPEWTRDGQYEPGDWVQSRGVAYRAKWWTRGADPSADVDNPWESPWERLDDVAAATPPPSTSTSTTSTTVSPAPAPASTTPTALP